MNSEEAQILDDMRKRYGFLGYTICAALNRHLRERKVVEHDLVPEFDTAEFSLVRDSFSGEFSLQALWRDGGGRRAGSVIIHDNVHYHAEYDVIRTMPGRGDRFIEAVTAWGGSDGAVKTELRVIPVPQ